MAEVTWPEFRRLESLAEKHEIELHGERGLYRAIEDLTEQLRWVQRALWALAGSIIVAALTFATVGIAH